MTWRFLAMLYTGCKLLNYGQNESFSKMELNLEKRVQRNIDLVNYYYQFDKCNSQIQYFGRFF